MITIDVPERELYDQVANEFFTIPAIHLKLEHSLRSMADWEGKWHVPFEELEKRRDPEMMLDYVRCMTTNQQKDPNAYRHIRTSDLQEILDYMNDPMTARKPSRKKRPPARNRIMTVENYYYLMIQYGIPMECQNWHFNRLAALIQTFEENGSANAITPGKKMTPAQTMKYYAEINERQKSLFGTKG